MLRCYMMAVCTGSSIDRDTNNMSMFLMVEELELPLGEHRPNAIGLEVHTYWHCTPDDVGNEFEVRVVRVAPDGIDEPGAAVKMHIRSERTRNRFFALRTPTKSGAYELRVEWRKSDEDAWKRDSIFWPLIIHEPQQHLAPPQLTQ